jgi:hypothetical protein
MAQSAEDEMKAMELAGYERENNWSDYNQGQQGVFALHPLMTPKYAKNRGSRDGEFRESLARMYLSLADLGDKEKARYLASIPNDNRVKALAEVLALSDTGFIDFFLQQVTEPHNEIVQIDKVLGDNYVAFFFGQEPPVYQFAGSLLNSMQDDQRTGFALAYQHLLRGSQLARRNALVRIRYDNVIMSGALLAASQTLSAENELIVPFQFSLLVKEMVWLRPPKGVKIDKTNFVRLASTFDPDDVLGNVGRTQDVRVRTTLNDVTVDAVTTIKQAEADEGYVYLPDGRRVPADSDDVYGVSLPEPTPDETIESQ